MTEQTENPIMGYLKGAGPVDALVVGMVGVMYFLGGDILKQLGSAEVATASLISTLIEMLAALLCFRLVLFVMDRWIGFSFRAWWKGNLSDADRTLYLSTRMVAVAIIVSAAI